MRPPISVILISSVFVIAGITGIIYHAKELKNLATDQEVTWVFVVRVAAVAGGWFAFRGHNWARWLLVAWIGYHVFLSFHHSMTEVAIHIFFTALTVLALFNRKANAYLRAR